MPLHRALGRRTHNPSMPRAVHAMTGAGADLPGPTAPGSVFPSAIFYSRHGHALLGPALADDATGDAQVQRQRRFRDDQRRMGAVRDQPVPKTLACRRTSLQRVTSVAAVGAVAFCRSATEFGCTRMQRSSAKTILFR